MHYFVDSTDDEFDVAKFSRFFGDKPAILDGSCVTVAPKNETTGAYNIHFQWQKLTDAKLQFKVEYFKGTRLHVGGERDPFAEDFMLWFGQFFKSPNVTSHLHARFRYALRDWNSVFLLPQKTSLPDGAELYGISLRLAPNSAGVSSLKIVQRKAVWDVEAIADLAIEFKEFDLFSDVAMIASAVSRFMERAS